MSKGLTEYLNELATSVGDWGRGNMPGWREKLSTAYQSTVKGARGIGGETLTRSSQALNDAIPFLERAGYDVTQIEVGVGLSPRVSAHLRLREVVDEETRKALLVEAGDRQMTLTILNALFSASAARHKLKFSNFHFTHIELEISILPTVILKFLPDTADQKLLEVTGDPDTHLLDAE